MTNSGVVSEAQEVRSQCTTATQLLEPKENNTQGNHSCTEIGKTNIITTPNRCICPLASKVSSTLQTAQMNPPLYIVF